MIELLVVVAIILILAGLLFPAVMSALAKGQAVKDGNSGRQICTALFSERMSRIAQGMGEILPDATYAGTSTAYFNSCLTSNYLDGFTARSFGATGLSAPAATNAVDAGCNAWCLTVGFVEGTAEDTPLLFTKNFYGWNGAAATALNLIGSLDPATKPFGSKLGIVIYTTGNFKIIFGKDMKTSLAESQKLFNPGASAFAFVRP